jgi:hypothetical protein
MYHSGKSFPTTRNLWALLPVCVVSLAMLGGLAPQGDDSLSQEAAAAAASTASPEIAGSALDAPASAEEPLASFGQ